MTLTAMDPRRRDALLGSALATGAVVQIAVSSVSGSPAGYVWVCLTTLPLVLRRRSPVVVGLGVQLIFALGTPWVEIPDNFAQGVSAFLVATYVAALGARSWRSSCASGVASLAILSLQGAVDPSYETTGAVVANVVYVAMTWAVAAAVRLQVERSRTSVIWAQDAVRTSEENARQAISDERARLARELHDVLGHSISVMVMRARGGVHDHRVDPARGLEALRDVEAVGSRAMADVRLLFELDHGTAPSEEETDGVGTVSSRHPQPGVDDLAALAEHTRTAGLDVELRECGRPRHLSASLGLAAYRVAQESLTNVMRHSRSRTAVVVLTWTEHDLAVEVHDDGPASPAPGGGRGLVGMNERVTLLGGALQFGPCPDGGFTVRARLPLAGVR